MTRIRLATTPEDIAAARELFLEYAAGLGFNLHFQDFDAELAGLPGIYAPPAGRLYLADTEEGPVGCVGVRPLDESTCEMKRLYVRPAGRALGLGRRLAETAISGAREAGYSRIRLDTLPTMPAAERLYRSLGFRDIPAYRFNPIPETRYLELVLG
jgi:GNAT superfamily N-acetyltransferase